MNLKMLLVVIDPARPTQPALQRAAWLARQNGATLELLVCEYHALLEGSSLFSSAAREKARQKLLQERLDWLESLAQPLRDEGLRVQTHARWGRPLQQQVQQRINELQPDCLFMAASDHGPLQQWLLSHSCWEVIRHITIPLWLVHHGDLGSYKRLCTAVDPLHSFDKPAALDHRMLGMASELAQQLGLQAHALHCHTPLPPSMLFDSEVVSHYPQYLKDAAAQHREAFAQLLADYPAIRGNSHLLEGYPEELIAHFVRSEAIDLLLMGAVSRSHLHSALIGNTAERILQQVDCDLLLFNSTPEK